MVTLDNASNNNTMMTSVAEELKVLGIPFDVVGNHNDYADALKCNVVSAATSLVTAIQGLGQRREDFKQIIEDGNMAEGWGVGDSLRPLRVVELLKDAVEKFLDRHPELDKYRLTPKQIEVLLDIQEYLLYAHMVQELLSAQRTPTLSVVLPLYEKLILELNAAKEDLPKISHAISASVAKLEEYLQYARQNRVYVLAMVLHPGIKLDWLMKHWSTADFVNAKSVVRTAIKRAIPTMSNVNKRKIRLP
ncbi:hypothetical protein F5877DRAFT_93789 [Lentinula edodes]|nr:hypothetical protein F5877DRAFT_93789 [Lentinula edodes]